MLPQPHQHLSSTGVRLRPPGELTHIQLLDCVKDSCLHPLYVDAYSLNQGFQVRFKQATIFKELHQPDAQGSTFDHFHVALLAQKPFRFAAIKKALLVRHQLASQWSCNHDGCWSKVRYGCCASPTKPLATVDPCPLSWAANGNHPPLQECCHPLLTNTFTSACSSEQGRQQQNSGACTSAFTSACTGACKTPARVPDYTTRARAKNVPEPFQTTVDGQNLAPPEFLA